MTWLDLLILLPFTLYGLRWALYPPVDGWGWSRSASACIYVAAALMLVEHNYPGLIRGASAPWILSALFWALARLLATAKFRDPTGIGRFRGGYVSMVSRLKFAVDAAFLGAMPLLYFGYHSWSQILLTMVLVFTLGWRTTHTDWRKIFKRSRRTSILYFFAQIGVSAVLIMQALHPNANLFHGALAALLLTGSLRLELHLIARRRGELFAREIQARIMEISSGIKKINTFVAAIDERFFPARISLVSVKEGQGLLLASAGTDAFAAEEGLRPRRLGPLIRRVVREKHILYAPVSEELGSELHNAGLKHSAIAIPVIRNEAVISVISFMAEEGERIAPSTAFALERLVETLAVELLTAIDQCHAELERDQLRAITKVRAAIEMESLDAWGRLPVLHTKEGRVALVLRPLRSSSALQALTESPQLSEIYETWQMEVSALWQCICGVFEFLPVPSDANDYVAFAPKEFSTPLLRHLGAEQCALIMGYLLRGHMQSLSAESGFAILSLPPPRIATARCSVRFHTQSQLGTRQLTIHSSDIFRIQTLLNASAPGQILIDTSDEALNEALQNKDFFETAPSIRHSTEIRTLAGLRADRKDVRRLELAIFDSWKASARHKGRATAA